MAYFGKGLLFLGVILFSLKSFASWPYEAYEHAYDFPMMLQGKFSTTLIGTCMEPRKSYRKMDGKVKKIYLKNRLLKSNKMKVRFAETKKATNPKKAPLVFFIPGAFNNLDDTQSKYMMSIFLSKGFNVLTVPNPWGTDFIKAGVKRPIGSIEYEGEVLYETYKSANKWLVANDYNVDDIRLIGISYGSFLAAMITTFNERDGRVLSIKDTTILSPPYHLGETIDRLDHYVYKSRPYINNHIGKLLYRFLNFCKKTSVSHRDSFSEQKAMALVIAAGFHKDLINSTLLYDKQNNLKKVPGRFLKWFNRNHLKWRKNWTFQKYFDTYAPEARDKMLSYKGDLNYWLDQSRSLGFHNFRILTSSNDFLNQPLSVHMPVDDTIHLDRGGHYGYRGLKWYRKLIDIAY